MSMSTRATGTIEMKTWEEKPYAEIGGAPKLCKAGGTDLYHGDIEGEATWEGVVMYRPDGSADFVSLERVVGRIGERQGTFVLQINGTVVEGRSKGTWVVVPGSGTGELAGLHGKGGLEYLQGQTSSMTLEYDLA
jgi:hypothetical protein